MVVEDCEDAWAEYTNGSITSTTDSADYQVGTKAVSLTATGSIASGNRLATEAVVLDLSTYTHVAFWVKSSVDMADGSLVFMIDEDAACASPSESLNIPALTAGQWQAVCIEFAGATSTRNAVISVGVKSGATISAGTIIRIDNVRALTAREFETIGIRGLNRPDDVIQSKGQVIELIDGDLYEVVPVKSRRVVTIDTPPMEYDDIAWLEEFFRVQEKWLIGDNDYFQVVNGNPGKYSLEWLNGISLARKPQLQFIEKSGWTEQPSSWGYA